ncbi:MAG TPA: hypothetical protein DCF68_00850 [Cyanothece sp. UBA12306]|nr:hypothetical protein [Cyanothece sp. UBA12306]
MTKQLDSKLDKNTKSSKQNKPTIEEFAAQNKIPNSAESEQIKITEFDNYNISKRVQPIKNKLAVVLAIIIFAVFGFVILWHIFAISYITWNLWNHPTDLTNVEEVMNKSASVVNDTAKTLYVVIIPLAATVMSFYFATNSNNKFFD